MNRTEARHEKASGLDALAPTEILALLADGQVAAAKAVQSSLESLRKAAGLMAAALGEGGRLIYAGAGSSGLMALADALELPGTYGIPEDRVRILLAGGADALSSLKGAPEDDVEAGKADLLALEPGRKDCVLAVSASGSTPYVLGIADVARLKGAQVVGIANNPGVPLFALANVAVLLATPPEVIAGSTRMGAGTAQKIAFNMMSTLAGVMLGHVHDGHMVNLKADNRKLRARASRMVSDITGIDLPSAEAVLAKADGSVKIAVLLASGASGTGEAASLLEACGGHLRPALRSLSAGTVTN